MEYRQAIYIPFGCGLRDSLSVFRSPLCTACSAFGSDAFGADLSGWPGFVLRAPPGSAPSIGSPPVVRLEDWVKV